MAVKRAVAHQAYAFAVHRRGDFVDGVVLGGGEGGDGGDEGVHFFVGDCHRCAEGFAAQKAVLERLGSGDDFVESVFCCVDKEKVGDEWLFSASPFASYVFYSGGKGGEYFESEVGQVLVCALFGVRAFEVAHNEPLLLYVGR